MEAQHPSPITNFKVNFTLDKSKIELCQCKYQVDFIHAYEFEQDSTPC